MCVRLPPLLLDLHTGSLPGTSLGGALEVSSDGVGASLLCSQAFRDRLPMAASATASATARGLRMSVLHWMCGHRVLVALVPNPNWK